MKNSKGYIVLEVLASFSLCCFLAVSALPMLQQLNTDRQDAVLRSKAAHMLYEKLSASMTARTVPADSKGEILGRPYEIRWKTSGTYPGMTEGCIEYENYRKNKQAVCDFFK